MNQILVQRYKTLSSQNPIVSEEARQTETPEHIGEDVSAEIVSHTMDKNTVSLKRERKGSSNPKWQSCIPNIRLGDLAGIEYILGDISSNIERPLKRPEVYTRLGIDPPRGILIYGPTGCGKTVLVHAIAGELGIPMFNVSATEIISGVSGESESNIRGIFDACIKLSTASIIFFDDIDLICSKRDSSQRDMDRRIVSQVMTSMDNIYDAKIPIMVIGATGRPEAIDPALRRAGRFDREIRINLPDEVSKRRKSPISSDVDFSFLARNTPGYAAADFKALLREAGHSAMDRDGIFPTSLSMQDFMVALGRVQPAAKREGFATVPDVSWTDIGALTGVRSELQMAVVEPLRRPELFQHIGISAPSGVLLWGPPGCGKTLLAKAVANETHSNFISIKGPELLNKYVGESERAIRLVFDRARMSAPCIIFFDELESLCAHRDEESSSHSARVVNQLLTEIDGLEGRRGIYLIGATNRPDMIDAAMLRPGRLDKLIYVQLPNMDERVDILRKQTRRARLSMDVDLEEIARDARCEGFTGADLSNLVRVASELAIEPIIRADSDCEFGSVFVMMEHFSMAMSRVYPSVSLEERQGYQRLLEQFTHGRRHGYVSGG